MSAKLVLYNLYTLHVFDLMNNSLFNCKNNFIPESNLVRVLSTKYFACVQGKDIVIYKCGKRHVTPNMTLQGHLADVTTLCRIDKYTLVSGAKDGNVRIWDIQSGVCLQVLSRHTLPICDIVLLADGNLYSLASTASTYHNTLQHEAIIWKFPSFSPCDVIDTNANYSDSDSTLSV